MALPLLALAGIQAGGSLLGGLLRRKAAKNAAKEQSQAADRAAAMNTEAGENAAAGVTQAGTHAAEGVEHAANQAAEGIDNAVGSSIARVDSSTDRANAVLSDRHAEAGQILDPYRTAGTNSLATLQDLVAGEGAQFQFSEDDPSYQFRLSEGQKALERSAAARGMLSSGRTLKALTGYAQNMASTEYQAAFDRFLANRGQRLNALNSMAGMGLDASGRLVSSGENFGNRASDNLINAGVYAGDTTKWGADTGGSFRYRGAFDGGQFRTGAAHDAGQFRTRGTAMASDYLTGGASARAAGHVGAGNAWSDAIGGVANAAQAWAAPRTLSELTRTPSYVPSSAYLPGGQMFPRRAPLAYS